MPTILSELQSAFVKYGIKEVTKTDIAKKAYLPNADQFNALLAAGYRPALSTAPTMVPIIKVGTNDVYDSSYYNSQRGNPAERGPETRMGRGIMRLITEGEELLLGTDGKNVFAHVLTAADVIVKPPVEVEKAAEVEKVYQQLDSKRLLERAKQAQSKPAVTSVLADQFARDPAVKALVIRRCGSTCEVPGCGWKGFKKEDGSIYIEVHHVKPLSEGGEDTVWNTAGICPNCHSLSHYGTSRDAFATKLLIVVAAAQKKFEASI